MPHTRRLPSVLVGVLVGSVNKSSRFVFTSRVDFSPLEAGRLSGEIGHLDLGEPAELPYLGPVRIDQQGLFIQGGHCGLQMQAAANPHRGNAVAVMFGNSGKLSIAGLIRSRR